MQFLQFSANSSLELSIENLIRKWNGPRNQFVGHSIVRITRLPAHRRSNRESLTGDERLSRSYLAVRHLLRQLEIKREKGLKSRIIPNWLDQFIDEISDRFEPFSGVARVGYECAFSEDVWELSIFLGETELIGGAQDGRMLPVNFRFDLTTITTQFQEIESIHWNAFPNNPAEVEGATDLSFLTINGTIDNDQVLLQLHSTPPDQVGPAIRQHADGRLELT